MGLHGCASSQVVRLSLFCHGRPEDAAHSFLGQVALENSVLQAVPRANPINAHPAIPLPFSPTQLTPHALSQSMTTSSVLEHSSYTSSTVAELARSTAASVQASGGVSQIADEEVRAALSKANDSREKMRAAIEEEIQKLRNVPQLHETTTTDTIVLASRTAHETVLAADGVMASLNGI